MSPVDRIALGLLIAAGLVAFARLVGECLHEVAMRKLGPPKGPR